MRKQILLFTILLSLFLAACDDVARPAITVPSQPLPASCSRNLFGNDAESNRIQAERCTADTTATALPIYNATVNAAAVTSEAGTAVANTATAVVTQTQVAGTQVAEEIALEKQRIDLQVYVDSLTAEAGAVKTAEARRILEEDAAATAEWVNIQIAQQNIADQQAAQRRNEQFWNFAKYFLLVFAALIIAGGTSFFAYWKWDGRRPKVAEDKFGRLLGVFVAEHMRALAPTALPRHEELQEPAGLLTVGSQERKGPNWAAFIQHRDPFLIPLGTDYDTREPIFIDRRRTPHVAFIGTSGSGKSGSGIVPFTLAMWGINANVLIFNGKGADYNALKGEDNIRITSAKDAGQLIRPLVSFLLAVEAEFNRRNHVLARYNALNWSALPAQAGESGEIVIILDEFYAIIKEAQRRATKAKRDNNPEEAREMLGRIDDLWYGLQAIVSQARKTGIFIVVALTDSTGGAIGSEAMEIARQCARVVYRMESGPSARTLLNIERGSDYSNGSVGLPTGEFLVNQSGAVRHGISFYPDEQDIENFLISRQVKPSPLPDLVLDAIQKDSGVWTTETAVRSNGHHPHNSQRQFTAPPHIQIPAHSQEEEDAQKLAGRLNELRSINQACLYLFDDLNTRPSAEQRDRLKSALFWLRDHQNNADAVRLLNKYQ